jgi:hypothetical protein
LGLLYQLVVRNLLWHSSVNLTILFYGHKGIKDCMASLEVIIKPSIHFL